MVVDTINPRLAGHISFYYYRRQTNISFRCKTQVTSVSLLYVGEQCNLTKPDNSISLNIGSLALLSH